VHIIKSLHICTSSSSSYQSPPADIQVKFYGDRPRETPSSGKG